MMSCMALSEIGWPHGLRILQAHTMRKRDLSTRLMPRASISTRRFGWSGTHLLPGASDCQARNNQAVATPTKVARLGLTPERAITILHRLVAAGWITRVKKGFCAVNDPVTRLPKAHHFAIGTAMVTPSAVSQWSALQHWGLTEQVPTNITLSSPRRTYHLSEGTHGGDDPRAWTVGRSIRVHRCRLGADLRRNTSLSR